MVICNFLSEFSPYILYNHLVFIFPFLVYYSGRGVVYILIGIVSISPELNIYLNYAGYIFIVIGLICFWLNWNLAKNLQLEYQDFVVMKDKYQDFNEGSQRNSLSFPKFAIDYNNNKKINNDNNNTNNEAKESEKKILLKSSSIISTSQKAEMNLL